jgi:2-polyprenyl-6-methoxyphenol hydroxylase-like FAD-dependent oxidoreductase
MDRTDDIIIVGARVAGASTAMLLARAGHRVVVLDRARRGSDTLSTHALMRPAVQQLERWGVLDQVIAAGTPGLDHVVFHYGAREVRLETSTTLYAPRRTVLDPLLVAAAERAGAELRFGTDVRGLLHGDDGRIVGVRVRDEQGGTTELRARVTIGADGRRSRVAAELQPAVTRTSATTSAFVYGYFAGVDADAYEWCYEHGVTAGLIPTGDGLAAVFVGVPPDRFTAELTGERGFLQALSAAFPSVGERVTAATCVGPIRGFPGLPGWLRRPWGPGWALVGDAGYFKDPTTAHGITDALRDAELLAIALEETLDGRSAPAEALGHYEQVRDQLAAPFFAITDRIASFEWTLAEVQQLHRDMSELMQREVDTLAGLDTAGASQVA